MNIKRILIILSIAALAASCTKDPSRPGGRAGKKAIGVNVSGCKDIATRAQSGDGEFFGSFVIDSIGGQVLKIDGFVSDYCPEETSAQTKASSSKITTTASIDQFWMTAYANAEWHDNTLPDGTDGSRTNPNDPGVYISKAKVSKDGTSGEWSIAGDPEWLNGVSLSFWSCRGSAYDDDLPVVNATSYDKATFSLTNNGKVDWIFAFNTESRTFDARTGEITGGTGTYNTGYKDKMDILFHHALAAVRFDVSGLKNSGLSIKEIALKGVASEAVCSLEGSSSRDVSFSWGDYSGSATISNEYASTDFTETGLDGTTASALMPMSSDRFFFLIPQAVKDKGITMEITYENAAGTETTVAASLSESALNHIPWVEGRCYTYKLSAGAVDLALTGTSPTVNVKNTGSTKAFLRVAIVGNWCMNFSGSLYPVSECPTSDITFTDLHNTTDDSITGAGGHWVLNTSDGYLYYSKPVDPGVEVPLFAGYSASTSATHPAGTTLKLTVVGQAVAAGSETSWAGAATVSL